MVCKRFDQRSYLHPDDLNPEERTKPLDGPARGTPSEPPPSDQLHQRQGARGSGDAGEKATAGALPAGAAAGSLLLGEHQRLRGRAPRGP
eukprot:4026881-Pyramimonas_sp.AAC.1